MEKLGNIVFGLLYYILKTLNILCWAFLLWIFLSGAEVAFSTPLPGVMPEYSAWNFFYLF